MSPYRDQATADAAKIAALEGRLKEYEAGEWPRVRLLWINFITVFAVLGVVSAVVCLVFGAKWSQAVDLQDAIRRDYLRASTANDECIAADHCAPLRSEFFKYRQECSAKLTKWAQKGCVLSMDNCNLELR